MGKNVFINRQAHTLATNYNKMSETIITATIDEQIAAQPAVIDAARKDYLAIGAKDGVTDAEIETAYNAWQTAKKHLTKLEGDKKAEELKAKAAEARSAELAKIDAFEKVIIAKYVADNDKKSTQDEKVAANEAYIAARTVAENKYLGNVAAPRATSATGNAKVSTGGPSKTDQYKALARELFAQGKTGAEVRKAAKDLPEYNDGTANAAIVAVEKELKLRD
jgi:hypothetical protein